VRGLAVDLGEDAIGCVLLGDAGRFSAGSVVRGTGEVARVPVGDALLGRVVDALGLPLDGGEPVAAAALAPVEQPASAIVDRALVTRPLAASASLSSAARLAAMESAHDNASKKLEQLRQDARRARQSEITTELLELVSGAQAVSNGRSHSF
jgi:vacuolar-type H+-ATPase subunit B/Vma2